MVELEPSAQAITIPPLDLYLPRTSLSISSSLPMSLFLWVLVMVQGSRKNDADCGLHCPRFSYMYAVLYKTGGEQPPVR